MKQYVLKALFSAVLMFWLPQTLFAADPSLSEAQGAAAAGKESAGSSGLRDPAAIAELKRATDFLVSLPRFHIKASVVYDVVQEDGRLLQFEKAGDIYLQRPDRIFADIRFDDGRWRQCWYDGRMLSLAERSKNLHTSLKAPPTIDGMLDMMEGLFKDPQPLADLYYSDLAPLDRLALEADVIGDSRVNGRPCTHLAFRGATVDWQFWIEQGTTPFIRKLAISYREAPGAPQSVAVLDLWETPDRFSDNLFNFTAPAGSQWIDMLAAMPHKMGKGGRP